MFFNSKTKQIGFRAFFIFLYLRHSLIINATWIKIGHHVCYFIEL